MLLITSCFDDLLLAAGIPLANFVDGLGLKVMFCRYDLLATFGKLVNPSKMLRINQSEVGSLTSLVLQVLFNGITF